MIEEVYEALAKTEIFSGMSRVHLRQLASSCVVEELKRNEYIFREREPGEAFYVILSGRVRISREVPGMGEEALAILGPGQYFGEMALVDSGARSADARVHEHVKLAILKKTEMDDILFINKALACDVLWGFVRTLTQRLRETNDKMVFLATSSKFS